MGQTPQEKYDEFIAKFRKEIMSKSLEEREKEMYEDLGEDEGNFLKEALKEIELYRKEKYNK